MTKDELNKAIENYLANRASPAEAKLVEDWYASFEALPGLTERLTEKERENAAAESFGALMGALKKK